MNNLRLKPYKHYWEGLDLDDPRISVICANKDFSKNLENYAKNTLGCSDLPTEVPTIHKATHNSTTITGDLRQRIYETRPEDKQIFDHFCS